MSTTRLALVAALVLLSAGTVAIAVIVKHARRR